MLFILYDIIASRIFYVILLHHMSMWPMWLWLMWPPSHAYMTCNVIFCLLCLCPNKKKEKETQNKIKENRIKPSPSFTTLTNKAFSTIKSMKMLENSTWDLLSEHKQLLYRICIISITLYRFQLWYFKSALVHQSLNKLKKI